MSSAPLVFIDTDIGVDDAFALTAAAAGCSIGGMSAVSGNVPAATALKNLKLFSAMHDIHCPLYLGASHALCTAAVNYAHYVHGEDGLGDAFPNPYSAQAPNAISGILDFFNAHPGEADLIALGPLTNLAIALNLDPELENKIRRVIVMGAAFMSHGTQGNIAPHAEFNVFCDPEAFDLVCASKLNLTVIPLDLTMRVILTAADIKNLHNPFLSKISYKYLDFCQKQEGLPGMAVHDALTIIYLLHPELFTLSYKALKVITEGPARGTILSGNPAFKMNNYFASRKPVALALDGNLEAIKAALLNTLSLCQSHPYCMTSDKALDANISFRKLLFIGDTENGILLRVQK